MICTSLSWPNMFDVARSRVNVDVNDKAILTRVKLILLTQPTELHMVPNFGVGLKKHMFKYNSDNVIALIQDELIEQLRLWEPCVVADKTIVERGPNHDWDLSRVGSIASRMNILDLRVTLQTIYTRTLSFNVSNVDIGY